jgi:hypothetical protein
VWARMRVSGGVARGRGGERGSCARNSNTPPPRAESAASACRLPPHACRLATPPPPEPSSCRLRKREGERGRERGGRGRERGERERQRRKRGSLREDWCQEEERSTGAGQATADTRELREYHRHTHHSVHPLPRTCSRFRCHCLHPRLQLSLPPRQSVTPPALAVTTPRLRPDGELAGWRQAVVCGDGLVCPRVDRHRRACLARSSATRREEQRAPPVYTPATHSPSIKPLLRVY